MGVIQVTLPISGALIEVVAGTFITKKIPIPVIGKVRGIKVEYVCLQTSVPDNPAAGFGMVMGVLGAGDVAEDWAAAAATIVGPAYFGLQLAGSLAQNFSWAYWDATPEMLACSILKPTVMNPGFIVPRSADGAFYLTLGVVGISCTNPAATEFNGRLSALVEIPSPTPTAVPPASTVPGTASDDPATESDADLLPPGLGTQTPDVYPTNPPTPSAPSPGATTAVPQWDPHRVVSIGGVQLTLGAIEAMFQSPLATALLSKFGQTKALVEKLLRAHGWKG